MKKALVDKVVEFEWEMFQTVNNEGGRAPCQDDLKTFKIMRSSQAMSWSVATLESYITDLMHARQDGRNLLTEKYARMMASTAPQEYEKIKQLLPPVSGEKQILIDKITKAHLAWQVQVAGKYPFVAGRGRPIFSSEDTPYTTSIETYMRGELATYSQQTLEHYFTNVATQQENNINGAEEILLNTMKQYGFSSLEQANEYAKNR